MAHRKSRINRIKGKAKHDVLQGTRGRDLLIGLGGKDTLRGMAGNDKLVGGTGNDNLDGGIGRDVLKGGKGKDILKGGKGNDILDGGTGKDLLKGGKGDDLYIIDNPRDKIREAAKQGIDTVQAPFSYVLGANLENLTLTGAGNLTGVGNQLANKITGNSGNDILDGKGGADTLIGGAGDDTYYVDDPNDVVIELAGGGFDRVITTLASYPRPAHIEFFEYRKPGSPVGTSNDQLNTDPSGGTVVNGAVNGTPSGSTGGNTSGGSTGGNTSGGNTSGGNTSGGNTSGGSTGNPNGSTSADVLQGTLGNDTYVVDNVNDVVQEPLNGGNDLVKSSVNFTLSANVENLELTDSAAIGTGNELDNTLTGNAADNTLNGGAGNDVLSGGAGNDKLIGGAGVDTLTGGAGSDTFALLAPITTGLADTITDFDPNSDIIALKDSTFSGLIGSLLGLVDGTVKTLTVGADGIVGGTPLDPASSFLTYDKQTGQLSLDSNGSLLPGLGNGGLLATLKDATGVAPNLSIIKIVLDSSLNALNDTGSSGTIADVFQGTLGDDTYVVDNVNDVVQEPLNGGTDLVKSSVDFTLSANVENLELTGSAAIGTGNELDNTLTGNAADNTLNGGAGNDVLSGGAGNDKLIGGTGVDTLTGGAGIDTFALLETVTNGLADKITDFDPNNDILALKNSTFSGLVGSVLGLVDGTVKTLNVGADGVVGGTPLDTASPFLTYDKQTGQLSLDSNGSLLPGLGSGGLLATLKDATGVTPNLSLLKIVLDSTLNSLP